MHDPEEFLTDMNGKEVIVIFDRHALEKLTGMLPKPQPYGASLLKVSGFLEYCNNNHLTLCNELNLTDVIGHIPFRSILRVETI